MGEILRCKCRQVKLDERTFLPKKKLWKSSPYLSFCEHFGESWLLFLGTGFWKGLSGLENSCSNTLLGNSDFVSLALLDLARPYTHWFLLQMCNTSFPFGGAVVKLNTNAVRFPQRLQLNVGVSSSMKPCDWPIARENCYQTWIVQGRNPFMFSSKRPHA